MLSRIEIIGIPPSSIVPLGELKQFVRVDDDADDYQLSQFLKQSTELAQEYLERPLLTTTFKWTIAHKPPANTYTGYGAYQWQAYGGGGFLFNGQFGCNGRIELPRNPVQDVISVARGYFGQPDVFLVPGTDYVTDLQTEPARIRMLSFSTGYQMDHLSVVFTAGYGSTNLITLTGTATATASLGLSVGGQTVSVAVNTGDTAQTVTTALGAAIQALGTPYGTQITPNMVQLRGANVAVTITGSVAGITATAGTPVSACPTAITEAIKYRAAQLYTNMTDSTADLDEWFYTAMKNARMVTFV